MLIPKGRADTRGIGLVEIVWNLVEAVSYTIIKAAVEFHDVLHEFQEERGTRKATLEIKLSQELDSMEQAPIFIALLDFRKWSNTYP